MVAIAAQQVGSGPQRVAFLHGLMGRGRNFYTIANRLGDDYSSLLIDVPNHGESGWTDRFSYIELADTIAEYLSRDFAYGGPVHLVGHSMGGKIAMVLALRHPQLVQRLVIEDIAPVNSATTGSQFKHLIGSVAAIDPTAARGRAGVDAELAKSVPDPQMRGFLMQNLRPRSDGGYYWQANVHVLLRDLSAVVGFPMLSEPPFPNPTLWVAGGNSHYVRREDLPRMRELFPAVRRMTINDAGHWVHAEQPERFLAVLRHFLTVSGW